MKGFIITEEDKNNIRKMYGIINEQTPLTSVNSSAGATVDPSVNFYYADDEWTPHEILTTIQIASAVLGMLPIPFAPLFWGISTIAGVADAVIYFKEDDPYMGTIVLALSLIPGNTLSIIFKSCKAFQILGVTGLKNLIKAYKLGKLSIKQARWLKEFTGIFKQPSVIKQVNKSLIETILLTLKNNLKDKSLKYLINFFIFLYKFLRGAGKLVKGLAEITFKIGGLTFTVDKLYLMIFADNQEYFNSREKNEFRAMINQYLSKYGHQFGREYDSYLNNSDVREQILKETDKLFDGMSDSDLGDFIKESESKVTISDKFNKRLREVINNIPDKKEEIPILRSVPTFQNLK